jgi:hypothetical protein
MSEFEEIGSAGGKIEIIHDSDHSVSLRLSSQAGGTWAAFQLAVSLDGKVIQYCQLRGVDMRPPEPPPQLAPIMVVSDKEGFFGRSCPKCRSYFRTSSPREICICPYCSHRDRNERFTTDNQLQFVTKVREAYREAIEKRQTVVIDLDKIARDLPANRPTWAYSEERQQTRFKCSGCETQYDILGEYAACPTCAKRNSLQVFEKHISELETQFNEADAKLSDRHEREVEWEKLSRCISDFEALGRDIQTQLGLLRSTPRRKNEIKGLSFQNIIKTNDCLLDWFGFEFLARFPDDDKDFLKRMFNRRHVLTHNAGRIDQEYLDNTQDTTVRLNQKIVVHSKDLRRLIPLLKKCAQNLFEAFESIT